MPENGPLSSTGLIFYDGCQKPVKNIYILLVCSHRKVRSALRKDYFYAHNSLSKDCHIGHIVDLCRGLLKLCLKDLG